MWPFIEIIGLARRIGGGALVAALADMEIPEIAAALGIHDQPSPASGQPGPIRSGGGTGTVARRMRAAQEGRDPVAEATANPAAMAWAAQFQAGRGVTDGGTPR